MLGLAAVVALTALLVARAGAESQVYPGFTQLWMLPEGPGSVTVGVRNEEGAEQSYMLAVMLDGAAFGEPVALTLAVGEAWQQSVPVGQPPAGTRAVVEARLFRPTDTEPYRRVGATLGEIETPPAPTPTPP